MILLVKEITQEFNNSEYYISLPPFYSREKHQCFDLNRLLSSYYSSRASESDALVAWANYNWLVVSICYYLFNK